MPVDLTKSGVDLTKRRNVMACIYGPPGSGKTTFASEAPTPAFMDFERSSDTIQSRLEHGKLPNWAGRVDEPTGIDQAWEYAREYIRSGKYQTLVIDTITRMQVVQMKQYIENHESVKSNRRDKYTTYQADYGYSANRIDEFLYWLSRQSINVIVLAHDRKWFKQSMDAQNQPVRTLIKIEPNLTPKATEGLQELFSFVGYLTNKPSGLPGGQRERKMQVNESAIVIAKNRLDIQEQDIKDPTYKNIFEKGIKT